MGVDIRKMISEVKDGLNRVEERAHFSATASKSDEWNNNLLDAIKKIRGNMRKIDRPSLVKHKWQNAAATLWVSGLTSKIKKAMAEEGAADGNAVTNPLAVSEGGPAGEGSDG